MSETRLFGLYDTQHGEVGRIVRERRKKHRGHSGTPEKDRTFQPPIRCIAMKDREYLPLQPQPLPIFGYMPERTVYTVEQVGSALAGYLALTINGTRWIVECRRQTLDAVARVHGIRVTVFPGLWEFDFGELADGQIPTIEVEDITDAENTTLCELFDDEDSVVFTGSVIVRAEAWCSFADSEETPAVVHHDVVDCIPYQTGAVKKGAVGLALWSWDAGYLVGNWQCRTFSHATGYSQDDDPVALEAV